MKMDEVHCLAERKRYRMKGLSKRFFGFFVNGPFPAGLFVLLFFFEVCFSLFSYYNYQDKMCLLGQVAAGSSEGLDMAARILKGERGSYGQGLAQLRAYGYTDAVQNRYYHDFLKQCLAAAVCFTAVLLLVWIFAAYKKMLWCAAAQTYMEQQAQHLQEFFEQGEPCNGQRFQAEDFQADWEGFRHLAGRAAAKRLQEAAVRVGSQWVRLAERIEAVREQSQEEKEKTKRMVTDISHQLKTPAAALDTCLSVLEDFSLNDAQRLEFQQRCRYELEALKTLLDALLQVSRMEAGMIQIVRKPVKILDTVVAAVNRIYPKISAKQMSASFDYQPEFEQLVIMHDEKWLCEAFINILDNAVKYSPNAGEVHIALHRRSSFVRIEFADEGIGIPKTDYHKIFKRFYRGKGKLVSRENGSGVGLYLAREIINRHHGLVSVKSAGRSKEGYPGSVFVVRIPLG